MANKKDLDDEIALTRQAVVDDEAADAAQNQADSVTIADKTAKIAELDAKIAELEAGADTQTAIDALKDMRTLLKAPGGGTTIPPGTGSTPPGQQIP